jgi:HEAT repeat protein
LREVLEGGVTELQREAVKSVIVMGDEEAGDLLKEAEKIRDQDVWMMVRHRSWMRELVKAWQI